jgi:pimeloyl-ACP methyl ester carboxylesterase
MISEFSPVSGDCSKTKTIPYMSPTVAGAEDNILLPYGWPAGILGNISMEFCVQPEHHKRNENFPLVLFSGGLNTTRFFYSAIAHEVASRGFNVLTIDHPFETDIVEFPDRTIAYGGHTNTSDLSSILFSLDIRSQDVSFILNELGFKEREKEKVAMFGHSFGGAATAAAMGNDSRIAGGVNLDGLLWGPVIETGFKSPGNKKFLLWGAEGHNSSSDESWGKFWSTLNKQGVWKRELSLEGGAHGSFWDLPLVADVAGIRDGLGNETEEGLLGLLGGERVVGVLADYLRDFFRWVMDPRRGEGLLRRESGEYPEVGVLN